MVDFWLYYFLVMIGALGAIFGSFITALTHRQHAGKSITRGRSACPHCSHELSSKDLIPIASYLLLWGKCRYCHSPLSPQYVFIEIGTALSFMGIFIFLYQQLLLHQSNFFLSEAITWFLLSLALLLSVVVILIALMVYDVRWKILPDRWTFSLAIGLLLGTALAYLLGKPLLWQPYAPMATGEVVAQSILSAIGAYAFFVLIVYGSEWVLKRPGMGMGDAKLAIGLGLLLGFPGIVVGLYLAFIFGAVLSLLLIAGKRKAFGNSIPFGPFMISGALVALWVTPHILNWYSKLLW